MTTTVLGLYCKEDSAGLFFRANPKSRAELWAYINKFLAKDTIRICTDSGKRYLGVQKLFDEGTVHLTTNHSIGESINRDDPPNSINDLENKNKFLKRTILCCRTPKLLHQYMARHYHRQHHRGKKVQRRPWFSSFSSYEALNNANHPARAGGIFRRLDFW